MGRRKKRNKISHFEAAETLSKLKVADKKKEWSTVEESPCNSEKGKEQGDGNNRKCGQCCVGSLCVAPTLQLCADHTCPGCKGVVHIHCAIFDGERDKWVCKKCAPLPPLSQPKTSSTTKEKSAKVAQGKEVSAIDTATMVDVVITKRPTNMIAVSRKSQGTKLKSIKDILVADITVDKH